MKLHQQCAGFYGLICLLSSASATAALNPLDDKALSDQTGQSGITIEMTSEMTIGQLQYKDEGYLQVSNIHIGGANRATYFGKNWGYGSHSGTALDGMHYLIDVLSDGDLVISAFIDPGLGGGAVDFGFSSGEVRLANQAGTQASTILNSVSVAGLATQFRARVDAQTSIITIQSQMGIADLDIDAAPLGFGIRNMIIANNTYLESVEEWGSSALSLPDVQVPIELAMLGREEGLYLSISRFNSDMSIGEIHVGGASIGSATLDNVNLDGINMLVYGH